MSAGKLLPWAKLLSLALIVAYFGGMYFRGAVRQMVEVNVDLGMTDQDAYIDYARRLVDSGYTYIGDYNRMPVYPILQSLFIQPEMKRRQIFEQGKWINLYLSIALLAGIALILGSRFSKLHTLNLLLITTFMVFIFKAGWFQSELLFYFLNFCLFLEMVALLKTPSFALAILTGVTAGLSHLTKASILPGMVIFALVYSLGLVRSWLRRRKELMLPLVSQTPGLLVLPLVLLFFLATISPYIATSKRVFGQYFYNVNSTFYIWYDSWEEAKQGTRAHGDRVGWPDMPPEQIPSLDKYLREHTLQQIARRFIDGAKAVWTRMLYSYGYLPYVLFYSALLAVVAIVYRQQTAALIRANLIQVTFVMIYFSAYLLLYFWYAPIVASNRLILGQFLPWTFSVSSGLHALLNDKSIRMVGRNAKTLDLVNLAVLPVLLFDIHNVLAIRVITILGGG